MSFQANEGCGVRSVLGVDSGQYSASVDISLNTLDSPLYARDRFYSMSARTIDTGET